MPDSVPIESEEERVVREEDEMAALDAVGDYEADPNVMLEDHIGGTNTGTHAHDTFRVLKTMS